MGKEKKNVTIELWKFIIVISIIGFNIGYVLKNSCNGFYIKQSMWFLGTYHAFIIIPIIIGYLLVNHYKNSKKELIKSPSKKSIEFIMSVIKKVLPLMIISYLMSIFIGVKFYYPSYNFVDILSMIINNIWSFLGFASIGLSSLNQEFYYLNYPLLIISSIIVVSYFIYYILCKNEELSVGFIIPILLIIFSTLFRSLLNNITIFTIYGMFIGVILYYIVDKLKSVRLTKKKKIILTVINAVCSSLLIWYIVYRPTIFNLEFNTIMLLSIIIVGITFLEKDYFTTLINNDYSTKVVFTYLGELSLYIYIIHYPIAVLILRILGPNSLSSVYSMFEIYVPTLVITIVLSAFVKNIINEIKNI